MRDARDYNPDWWRDAKAASLARRQRQASPAAAQPGDAFLIVTEGTVTEPEYFRQLRSALRLSTVHIKVQPGDRSDPLHVIETASREARAQIRRAKQGVLGIDEPEMFDHIWAVIDTDVAVRQGRWNDVVQRAAARKVTIAPSSPCFEFWLLLHLTYTTRTDLVDGERAKAVVEQALGQEYSTSKEGTKKAIAALLPTWRQAVVHAERVCRYHEKAATPEPANPSTRVGQLVSALNDTAPEHVRKSKLAT